MRSVLVALAMVVAGAAHAETLTCKFPGHPVLKLDPAAHVLSVAGTKYPIRLYTEDDAGGPGLAYRDGKTWSLGSVDSGPLKTDAGLVYVRVDGNQSRYIVDDRTNPSLKGACH